MTPRLVQTLVHTSLMLGGCLMAPGAYATSPQEEKIFGTPSPHQQSGHGGQPVKVHRARMHGHSEGQRGNAAALAELKQHVQRCVANHNKTGYPVNPPTAWPDYALSQRTDQYMAANRSIRYSIGVTYLVRIEDCNLIANIVHKAQLLSSNGMCDIDLVRKTAEGRCDPTGHADAPAEPRGVMPDPAAVLKKLAANPAFAGASGGLQHAVVMTPTKTGQQKTIRGIRCDVWSEPALKGTRCYAAGGSFAPAREAGNPRWAGLLLETDIPDGMQATAVDAMLDTQVSSAVFTPYAAAGFTITNRGPTQ